MNIAEGDESSDSDISISSNEDSSMVAITLNDEHSMVDMGKIMSKSTSKQYKTAKNHFAKFLLAKNSKHDIFNLTNMYLTTTLIGEFATYMIRVIKIPALSTLLSYISDLKNYLEELYPHASAFTDPTEKWYSKVRTNLSKEWMRISEGDGVEYEDVPALEERHIEFITTVLLEEKILIIKLVTILIIKLVNF